MYMFDVIKICNKFNRKITIFFQTAKKSLLNLLVSIGYRCCNCCAFVSVILCFCTASKSMIFYSNCQNVDEFKQRNTVAVPTYCRLLKVPTYLFINNYMNTWTHVLVFLNARPVSVGTIILGTLITAYNTILKEKSA